jgi:outer membrane protein W
MSTKLLRGLAIAGVLGACGWALPATAQDRGPFFIRVGPAYENVDASAHVSVAGTAVPGGDVSVHSNTGGEIEAGYALTPSWEITLAIGIPLKARFFGTGTLSAAGKLGEAMRRPISRWTTPPARRCNSAANTRSTVNGPGTSTSRIWLKTDAGGVIATQAGAQPASAHVTLDPVILNTGLSLHL